MGFPLKSQNTITYFEKPITNDEKKVAALIEKMSHVFNENNPDLLREILSESSILAMMIDNKEKILTKNEYIDYTLKILEKIRSISYKDVLIRITDKSEAILCCWCFISFYGKISPLITQRYFKCRQEKEGWRIVEAQYIK